MKLLAGYFILNNSQNNSGIIYSGNCVVTIFAGNGNVGSVDGIGTSASFDNAASVVVDSSDNIYVTTLAGKGDKSRKQRWSWLFSFF